MLERWVNTTSKTRSGLDNLPDATFPESFGFILGRRGKTLVKLGATYVHHIEMDQSDQISKTTESFIKVLFTFLTLFDGQSVYCSRPPGGFRVALDSLVL